MKKFLLMLLLSPLVYSESIYLACQNEKRGGLGNEDTRLITIDRSKKIISLYQYVQKSSNKYFEIQPSFGSKPYFYEELKLNLGKETNSYFSGGYQGKPSLYVDRVKASSGFKGKEVSNCKSVSGSKFNRALKQLRKRVEKDKPKAKF